MMEPALPQRQRSSALCPEWPEVAKKAEGFLQVIRRAPIVGTEGGSGMRWGVAAKVPRAVDLNRHVVAAVPEHGVEAVALRGSDLLSRGQPQCPQRRDNVAVQLRSHAILAAEGDTAAQGKLERQPSGDPIVQA